MQNRRRGWLSGWSYIGFVPTIQLLAAATAYTLGTLSWELLTGSFWIWVFGSLMAVLAALHLRSRSTKP